MSMAADATVGVVLLHGKDGIPGTVSGLTDALRKNGFAVTTPEMPYSKYRNFDKAYEDTVPEIDKAVAELCKKNGYNFGGELSGHFIFFDYADTGDGTLSALQVLKIMIEKKQKLSELAYTFEKFPQKRFDVEIKKKIPLETIPEIVELQKKWTNELKSDGRVFLRYSGTENLLRIMVEVKDETLLDKIGNEFVEVANKILN